MTLIKLEVFERCPRPICDKGMVFDTVDGVRKGPGYICSACKGEGFVTSTAYQGAVDAIEDALAVLRDRGQDDDFAARAQAIAVLQAALDHLRGR